MSDALSRDSAERGRRTGETEAPTPAQVFICGSLLTYYADEHGSVKTDYRQGIVRRYIAATGAVIERAIRS